RSLGYRREEIDLAVDAHRHDDVAEDQLRLHAGGQARGDEEAAAGDDGQGDVGVCDVHAAQRRRLAGVEAVAGRARAAVSALVGQFRTVAVAGRRAVGGPAEARLEVVDHRLAAVRGDRSDVVEEHAAPAQV